MNRQEIENLITQMIDENAARDQFAVSDTPFHTHNGIDSMKLKFTNMTDVPSSYYQQKGRSVVVNGTESGLTFSGDVLNTTATDGFVAIPSCAGTPTGIPTSGTGSMILDTSAGKLWIYYGGAWHFNNLT